MFSRSNKNNFINCRLKKSELSGAVRMEGLISISVVVVFFFLFFFFLFFFAQTVRHNRRSKIKTCQDDNMICPPENISTTTLAAPFEYVFSCMCGQRWPRSACVSAQSDQDLRKQSHCFSGEQILR